MIDAGRPQGRTPLLCSRVWPVQATGWPLVAALLVFETSFFLSLIALYKKDISPWGSFLWSYPGWAFLVGFIGLCGSAAVVGRIFWKNWGAKHKEMSFTLIMNAVVLLAVGGGGELMVRMVKTQTVDGRDQVRERLLLPRDWERTRQHYQEVIEKASGDLSYLIYDAQLGWGVVDGRQSENGLYRSGQNGIRTREAGDIVERQPEKKLVALVGDSFTFGEEVAYDETWAVHLQQLLGNEFQVVNFGVPGYGVDQMYLRYMRDVLKWEPDIVIFGFISHDLIRSMTVYTFLNFPEWDSPYSKPRFVPASAGLQLLNSPTMQPQNIFSARAIADLPAIWHDPGYQESHWEHEWIHSSDLVRFIQARFPRRARLSTQTTDESVIDLNKRIVSMFLETAGNSKSIPLLAYLPSSEDFWTDRNGPTLGKVFFEALGHPYIDPTACLKDVAAGDRFVRGNGHYSGLGNAAVARCFASQVRRVSQQRGVSSADTRNGAR